MDMMIAVSNLCVVSFTVSMCSSVSPYHEVMRLERRLRSASEGAGGPRLHLNLRDPHCMEGNTLSKQRTSSSSSKLGSLVSMNVIPLLKITFLKKLVVVELVYLI